MKKIKTLGCWGLQFCSGGVSYGIIETLWRGYTHVSMLLAGGFCFWLIIRIAKMENGLLVKSLFGGICITVIEFISGCIVNIWLKLNVWDYTLEPLSIFGQICIRYVLLWITLSAIAIPICRYFIDYKKTRMFMRLQTLASAKKGGVSTCTIDTPQQDYRG